MDRRSFLRSASIPFLTAARVLGANDRLDIGFIGLGGRARWLLQNEDWSGVRIRAVADCFLPRAHDAATLRPDGNSWNKYQDYRRLLDKEKLDAVFIETTTHARALIAIHAMQAGLDVYAEKPVTLTIEEGRVLRSAVRRYNRVLQAGTQQRSMPMNIYASRLVSSGKIGRIEHVTVCKFIAPELWEARRAGPSVPDGLDWDQWCNQTEMRPYHSLLHRGWPRWRDYDGGGESWGVSGWGTHSLDQVQAALGTDDTGPVEITPSNATATSVVTLRYANGTVVVLDEEIRRDHSQLGAIFEGTNGRIQILRGDFVTNCPELRKDAPDLTVEGPGENDFHLRNFFECVRSRKRPNADIETAHRATSVCHLVNIAREVGRPLKWDPAAERFIDNEPANRLIARERRKGYELPTL